MDPPDPAAPLPAGRAEELLAASPAALALADGDGTLRWTNRAFDMLAGAAGASLAERLALDAGGRDRLGTLLRGDAETAELDAGGTDRPRPVHAAATRLGDGAVLLALTPIGTVAAARQENQRLTEMVEMARTLGRLGFWERDLVTGRGTWDREVFRMRGLVGDGEAPPVEAGFGAVLEADRPGFAEVVEQSFRHTGEYSYRYRVVDAGGDVRQLHSHWHVSADETGRPRRASGLVIDETETHQLARSYGEMLSQMALAVDLASIAIWRHDLATGRVHYNDEGYRMLQIAPRPEGLPIDTFAALVHPDDLQHVVTSAQTALETGRPTDTEARYRRADGEWRTLLTRRVLQRDANGSPAAFVGVALDVTDRIDESRRAVELGRRFELATRTAGIGYWSLEDGAERARWSVQLRAIHGLDAGAPVPTLEDWLTGFVHPDDRAEVQHSFREWLKSGRGSVERDMRIVRSDGEMRYLITHSRLEGTSAHPLLFGLVIDVTERRRVEVALREASERAALAARSAGLGTWEIDLRTNATYWDAQMWRLRGLEPQATPPTEEERLALVHPDDRDRVGRLVEQALTEDAPSDYEFRVVLADGRVRWLASRSMSLGDERGRLARRIGVNWDVTDTRTADAVRQEREVAQRESQAKSKFLARMSHELRTPLNGVLGFAQLLLAEDGGSDKEASVRRRRVEQIRSAGQHLLSLINDVLDLSSLEGGEMRIVLQPVALGPLVAETIPLLDPLLRDNGVELACGALDVVPLADATRLRQVLLNLLSNAVKYNRPGGRVTLEAARHGSGVLVRVSDTGRGMSDDQMRHLFEPFNRLGIENEGIEGTGIGLAIVKALVERMGGSIHVDSQIGHGSVFELRLADASLRPLPVAEAAPGATASSRPLPLAAGASPPRGTLLYIEDNPVNALIISELVARRPDLVLHIAADGASGVSQARSLRPDLVLLDMQLPDFDGHEVLRRLRAEPSTARIPVIALSANAMPEDIDRALRAGMADYWTKPLDFGAFMASLESLFGPPPSTARP